MLSWPIGQRRVMEYGVVIGIRMLLNQIALHHIKNQKRALIRMICGSIEVQLNIIIT